MFLSGCASKQYVPVAMQRSVPRPPVECLDKDPAFPKVAVPAGSKTISPTESARWGITARQWAAMISSRREICRRYARQMQTWK
jgi:hypothetical protein